MYYTTALDKAEIKSKIVNRDKHIFCKLIIVNKPSIHNTQTYERGQITSFISYFQS